jgi:hypothetical protein
MMVPLRGHEGQDSCSTRGFDAPMGTTIAHHHGFSPSNRGPLKYLNLLALLPDLLSSELPTFASMEAQMTDEELQQLLQELDTIPPGNLPVGDIHPFSSYETTSLTDFINFPDSNGYCPDTPKADSEREAMRKKIEQLEKQY